MFVLLVFSLFKCSSKINLIPQPPQSTDTFTSHSIWNSLDNHKPYSTALKTLTYEHTLNADFCSCTCDTAMYVVLNVYYVWVCNKCQCTCISFILVSCLFTMLPTVHMKTFLSLLLTSNPIHNQTLSLLGHTCLHCVSAHLYIQIINKCMIFHLCTHHHTCVNACTVYSIYQLELFEPTTLLLIFMLDSVHVWLVYIIVVYLIQWMMLCWNYHEFVISALVFAVLVELQKLHYGTLWCAKFSMRISQGNTCFAHKEELLQSI